MPITRLRHGIVDSRRPRVLTRALGSCLFTNLLFASASNAGAVADSTAVGVALPGDNPVRFLSSATAPMVREKIRTFKQNAALPVNSSRAAQSAAKPDAAYLAQLQTHQGPEGSWGGPNCAAVADLRSLVDTFLATPNPNFPGLGPTIPGVSVSLSSPGCGTFNYAAGLSNIERNKRLTPATRMQIASMSKAIIAAVTLRLSESGAFGRRGLGTSVKELLTPKQIKALTVGDNPAQPRCPGFAYLLNRDTGSFDWTAFSCPDLSRVTLRDLMRANAGMYDFAKEVLLPDEGSQYYEGLLFELLKFYGLNPMPPVNPRNGFDALKAYGLKENNSAIVGGSSGRDFEVDLGNTGFELLGIILEHTTGRTLDELVRTLIVTPLKLDPIEVYLDPARQGIDTARGYDVLDGLEFVPGFPTVEQTAVYPIVDLNGNTALNTLSYGLGQPGNLNFAGAAGALIANPKSYRAFLQAFVNGGLLGRVAQRELNNSFVQVPDYSAPPQVTFLNGFGLTKLQLRGIPGTADSDEIFHPGAFFGAFCWDEIIYAPDSNILRGTVVVCQNSFLNTFPLIPDLAAEFAAVLNSP
jgi:CubicO group peptidase (beta-lactamase class C family)